MSNAAPVTGQVLTWNGTQWIPSDVTPVGGVVQVSQVQTNSANTYGTVIPFDNTIPQRGEGTIFLASTIVPKFSTSDLLIEVVAYVFETNTSNSVISGARYL